MSKRAFLRVTHRVSFGAALLGALVVVAPAAAQLDVVKTKTVLPSSPPLAVQTDGTYVSITDMMGEGAVFQSGIDFEAGTTVEDVTVEVTWGKSDVDCGQTPGMNNAFHEDTMIRVRQVSTNFSRDLIREGSSLTADYTGTHAHGYLSAPPSVTNTFEDSGSLPPFPQTQDGTTLLFYPSGGQSLQPGDGTLRGRYMTTSPFGEWLVEAATQYVASTELCIYGYKITVTLQQPLADIAPVMLEEGSYVDVDMSGSKDAEDEINNYEYDCDDSNGVTYTDIDADSVADEACQYCDEGTYTASARVSNSDGFSDTTTEDFEIVNGSPSLTGTPGTAAASVDSPYMHDFGATDPSEACLGPGTGDTLTFTRTSLSPTPVNDITINPTTGDVSWAPVCADLLANNGSNFAMQAYDITVEVDDGDGGTDEHSWTITLSDVDTDDDVACAEAPGDGITNCADNCRAHCNAGQEDYDGDALSPGGDFGGFAPYAYPHGGDACDTDDDNDNVPDTGEDSDQCDNSTRNAGDGFNPTFISTQSPGTGTDWDADGCEDADGGVGGMSNCCTGGNGVGCNDPVCEATVCGVDPFCCSVAWDGICDGEGVSLCNNCVLPGGEEDTDDDNDTKPDASDSCPFSINNMGDNITPSFISSQYPGPVTDFDADGCEDDSAEDTDDDGDTVEDVDDDCLTSVDGFFTGWTSTPDTDHDTDGCRDSAAEDPDDDNDGMEDGDDDCDPDSGFPNSDLGWTSDGSTDVDSDGCQDDGEDTDDDNDEQPDGTDDCDQDSGDPGSDQDWASSESSEDYDDDGCRDEDVGGEDDDDDNDLNPDATDACDPDTGGEQVPADTGGVNSTPDWDSTDNALDHDDDGCKDQDPGEEDGDDDNDQRVDANDLCDPDSGDASSEVDWDATGVDPFQDYDADGCHDTTTEDLDDDNDGVDDDDDDCANGTNPYHSVTNPTGFLSGPETDNDGDGCEQVVQDADDDNDGNVDEFASDDACSPLGPGTTQNGPFTDFDDDGCKDDAPNEEDTDDDQDSVPDGADACDNSLGNDGDYPSPDFVSTQAPAPGNDWDADGCKDDAPNAQDPDDDNDGRADGSDNCDPDAAGGANDTGVASSARGPGMGTFDSTDGGEDYDADGCEDDNAEDPDDDNDGAGDFPADQCPMSASNAGDGDGTPSFVSTQAPGTGTDWDDDGCEDDNAEDPDDDNDGLADTADQCDPDVGLPDAALDAGDDFGNSQSEIDWDADPTANKDYDADGCLDKPTLAFPANPAEDRDDDNDGRDDGLDDCDPDLDDPLLDTHASAPTMPTSKMSQRGPALGGPPSPPVTLFDSTDAGQDHDSDGCKDGHSEDVNDDGDAYLDNADDCRDGNIRWAGPDYDSDGCEDATAEETDHDNDTVPDASDSCDFSVNNVFQDWISAPATDHDRDGCKDDTTEDPDDDNDGMDDGDDDCPKSPSNAGDGTSPSFTADSEDDVDADGCEDDHAEDPDDDNDGQLDGTDDCDQDSGDPGSQQGWNSALAAEDYDDDGCRDEEVLGEDTDDDNDNRPDDSDVCDPDLGMPPANDTGAVNSTKDWDSTDNAQDHDDDGCKDQAPGAEDGDDDGDGRPDADDLCDPDSGNANSNTGWTSTGGGAGTDYDLDGCQDDTAEDPDKDNDGVNDGPDACEEGSDPFHPTTNPTGFVSDSTAPGINDNDGDGCEQVVDDLDDDNDGNDDETNDACSPLTGPRQNGPFTDYDNDGCKDDAPNAEDADDDQDGMPDAMDTCPNSASNANGFPTPSFVSTQAPGTGSDWDADGCEDATEDPDDDNDMRPDAGDACDPDLLAGGPATDTGAAASVRGPGLGAFNSTVAGQDFDADGCMDANAEDPDDDNDGKPDAMDTVCPKSTSNAGDGANPTFVSNSSTDYDDDGCDDSAAEDMDDDNDTRPDASDDCDPDVELGPDSDQGADESDTGWTSTAGAPGTDYDADGCQDSGEDTDDDNDGRSDDTDACDPDPVAGGPASDGDIDSSQKGSAPWSSTDPAQDHDADGCRDNSPEDTDDDNDGLPDGPDDCDPDLTGGTDHGTSDSDTGWTSDGTSDYDGDGCQDDGEDTDDDNDKRPDATDACDPDDAAGGPAGGSPVGDTGAVSSVMEWDSNIGAVDFDRDGCDDAAEDPDDDNDGVADGPDACEKTPTNAADGASPTFVSGPGTDHDSDGCQDSGEDTDDDNDTRSDGTDACDPDSDNTPPSSTGWNSGSTGEDNDADGCRDQGVGGEDADDDNDGVLDTFPDNCRLVANPGQEDTDTDNIGDACDGDLDGDTIPDGSDNCPSASNMNQQNTDGAADGGDVCDDDDDNDLFDDFEDNCPLIANNGQEDMDMDGIGNVCDPDRDGDLVDNDDETDENVLTDPDDPDTDGDTIDDGAEIGPNPNAPTNTDVATEASPVIDALDLDSDGDGHTDADEAGDESVGTPPVDTDEDGTPDFQDLDSDDDTVLDADDNCRIDDNLDQADLDMDDIGDLCDDDDDGDNVTDNEETAQTFTDPRNQDTDADTIRDDHEIFNEAAGSDPTDPSNHDADPFIDALDTDSDSDNVTDLFEAGDADLTTPPVDTDEDGFADFRDQDSDDDGVADGTDNCRIVTNGPVMAVVSGDNQTDSDGDGAGDVCDGDVDGDDVPDVEDNCPTLANTDQTDTDGDDAGNACDADDDGDGDDDVDDNCPLVANADQDDADEDDLGDACDGDVDGDGEPDTSDNCPMVANADQDDLDDDNLGDACDADDDGDEVDDVDDNCPTEANEDQADFNGDDEGDACEPDEGDLPPVPVPGTDDDAGVAGSGGTGGGGAGTGGAGGTSAPDAGMEMITCDPESLLTALDIMVPDPLTEEAVRAELDRHGVEIPDDATIDDIEEILATSGIMLPPGCTVDDLLGALGITDDCSCRVVGADRSLGGLRATVLFGFALVFAYRMRRRRR
jgi:hypothetical protein